MEQINATTGEVTIRNTSPTIGKIADALAKAQGKIKGAVKDSENPHFRAKYADLASVWDACREQLSANGIAVIQVPSGGPEVVSITTLLAHSSGEWIRGELSLRPVKADPQGIGSAITYGRRYGLAAMVGVAPEDDDGEAASGRSTPRAEKSNGNGQARTAAPQHNADEPWKKDAERIKQGIKAHTELMPLEAFLKQEEKTLATIKENSPSAHDFLVKGADAARAVLKKAA